MTSDPRRLVSELRASLEAESDLPFADHVLLPRAEPRIPPAEKAIERIAGEVRACRRCALCKTRKNAVPGQGSAETPVLFVGEAPGADEDAQGLAFIGKAGELLTNMLKAIGISRDEVFITNILKCRPPGNRNPLPDEAAQCRRYLDAQIAAIRPKVIVTLGAVPTQQLLETSRGILSIRGTPRPFRYEGGTATLLPTLHPAYVLRNVSAKREAWDDLKLLHRLLREATGDWPSPLGGKSG